MSKQTRSEQKRKWKSMLDRLPFKRSQQTEEEKEEKKRRKRSRKEEKTYVRRLVPVWLKIIIILVLSLLSLLIGMMIGFSVLGDGHPLDVLRVETWKHIIDIVWADK
ncbi:DNA-directed RNA polymerase subunit beta [Gracilibacillus sp. YIM 98692]|uniref:DNA-directed RNA polymerase subunit beta n=1 Tax=Gracilibacillus sp. YIM 98692 TaxID=2663532 RepID=UPI0013CF57A1|nr:DNA-directed RNA polymerase subunit beta [Gracilibacillus sp. YIM 98692]